MDSYRENKSSRFNVVVRLSPLLGDEKTSLMTEDDAYVCVTKTVIFNLNLIIV